MKRTTRACVGVFALSFIAAGNAGAQPKGEFRGRDVPRLGCGTPQLSQAEKDQVDLATNERSAALGVEARAAGSVTIPVWIHVVNQGTGLSNGDVPSTMINQQITVLNNSCNGNTGGANTPFRFTLAGVTRRTNAALFNNCESSSYKAALKSVRVGGAETLNIYTCNPASLFGWATYPSNYDWDPQGDGVVVHFGTLPGSTWAPFNTGDTGVHEAGHWLGLYHTFEGGCTPNNDKVSDTPAEKTAHWGCPVGLDSCPRRAGLDPITNFMAYTDDSCMYEFTSGQSSRMDVQHGTYRTP
jgi:hypothetical protein